MNYIKNSIIILLLFCLIGLFSCSNIDLRPVNTVQVMVIANGYSINDVEHQITIPLERAIGKQPGITINSISFEGKCIITIRSHQAEDSLLYGIREKIKETRLPDGINPFVKKVEVTNLVRYTVQSDKRTLSELAKINSEVLTEEFNRYPGSILASAYGGGETGVIIKPSLQKMAAYDVTIEDLTNELNKIFSGFRSTVNSIEDLSSLVIKNTGSNSILLKDIAVISVEGIKSEQAVFCGNGQMAHEGVVAFRQGEDISHCFNNVLKSVQTKIPGDISVVPFNWPVSENKNQLILKAVFPPGVKKEVRINCAAKAAALIFKTPGIKDLVYDTGVSLSGDVNEEREVTFYLTIDKMSSTEKLETELSSNIKMPGVSFYFQHQQGEEWPAEYSFKIYCDEPADVEGVLSGLESQLQKFSGVADVRSIGAYKEPVTEIILDRESMAKYGITMSSASQLIEIALNNKTWEHTKSGMVCLMVTEPGDISQIGDLRVKTVSGNIPLSQLVKIIRKASYVSVLRENSRRYVELNFSVSDKETLKNIETSVFKSTSLMLPKGVTVQLLPRSL